MLHIWTLQLESVILQPEEGEPLWPCICLLSGRALAAKSVITRSRVIIWFIAPLYTIMTENFLIFWYLFMNFIDIQQSPKVIFSYTSQKKISFAFFWNAVFFCEVISLHTDNLQTYKFVMVYDRFLFLYIYI